MSASDDHNASTRKWIVGVAGKAGTEAELMVVVESTIFGAMLLLEWQFGMNKRDCAEMVESAIQRATERFT